jgi:uncharacterized protein
MRLAPRAIAGFAAATLALAAAVAWGIGWLLSRPVPVRIGPAPADLFAEDVTFRSASGSVIHGWLSRGSPQGGAILLLPGVRANRLSMVSRARMLRAAGYSTLLIDFQATGDSPGEAITFGWRERLDVIAAVQALRRLSPGEPIGIVGTSLGGAAALLAAPDVRVEGVVLEAVYPSLDAAVGNRLRMRFGAAAPALAPLLVVQLWPRLGVWPSDLTPVDRIAELRCPVLVIGGTVDRHTTIADTQQLYAAARPPKELWLIPGAAHVDFFRFSGADYQRRLLTFFEGALRWSARSSLS